MKMFEADDYRYMARAIQLARKGLYSADPNPRVGCVLVKGGEVVGEGYHRQAGKPHAEPNALAAAGEAARGATAYVTLEPCCHHGKTPPCSEALIQAGVKRVVVAMVDPHRKVAGQGLAQLRAAGIETGSGLLEEQAWALNPGFIKRMNHALPYVRCKLATSLDGRTAMASGESKWISSEAARLDVQRLRARSSAILTGIGTVLADDPSMNIRVAAEALQPGLTDDELIQPLRVVLDSRLQMLPSARMLSLPGQTLVAHAQENPAAANALRDAGAALVSVPGPGGQVEPKQLLRHLADLQLNEVLIEAGPKLAGRFLAAGLIDELVIYMAPHLMGHDGQALFHLPGLEEMRQRIGLEITDMRRIGPDFRITAALGSL